MRSFVEATRYLLTLPGVTGQYVLSERFSQNPLENYVSCQRASGGRCDNPTASDTLNCAQSLRVQGSLALQSVRCNCSRKRRLSLTSSQSLMTHHYQRGQGSSLVTNVFSYACIYYRCQYYVPQFVMLCAVLKGKGIKPMLFCLLESKVFSQSLFLASTLL